MQLKPETTLQNGRYRIIKSLGQGGFGITYLAEQVALGRKVAVKEFFMKDCCERDEATSAVTVGTGSQRELVEKFREKFLREARMISQLDHPNIVRIIDVFAENGTAYYTMDYIVGGSLKELVAERGPLDEPTALKYIREVGEALQYVHRKKILHFDIKPSNIMLRESGTAALIDFGVSKHYDEGGHVTSSTPVGISKGYAPLEQYRQDEISTFTPATDIYALGATLYTLLTGLVPPDASDVYEDGLPVLPTHLSASTCQAIEKAMTPRRKDRPQSVTEFLALLDVKAAPAVVSPTTEEPAVSAPKAVSEETVILGTEGRIHESHEWVDLGLSVKWATCNVGAKSPSDHGDYFAWGETEPKEQYSWKTYLFRKKFDWFGVKFSKYVTLKGHGEVDHLVRLDGRDDVAKKHWGGNWRMPTDAEWTELREKCEWTWTTKGGENGYEVKSKNGNSIFLPAAGYWGEGSLDDAGSHGCYWSSSLFTGFPYDALLVSFDSSGVLRRSDYRYYGFSVRPVTE